MLAGRASLSPPPRPAMQASDSQGRNYVWECVERATKHNESDGVGVIARVQSRVQGTEQILLVVQWRAPFNKFVVEVSCSLLRAVCLESTMHGCINAGHGVQAARSCKQCVHPQHTACTLQPASSHRPARLTAGFALPHSCPLGCWTSVKQSQKQLLGSFWRRLVGCRHLDLACLPDGLVIQDSHRRRSSPPCSACEARLPLPAAPCPS